MKKIVFFSGLSFILGLFLGWLKFFHALKSKHGVENATVDSPTIEEVMPVRIGAKRLAMQFSSLLPQVHLTLISILQGVALGILIERIDYQTFELRTLPSYIASLIIIALIWHLYANAFITFVWPFWGLHTLLQFLLVAFEIFALASISNPTIWVLGISGMAIIGSIIRWLNTKIVSPAHYERDEDYVADMKIEKSAAKQLFWISVTLLSVGASQYTLSLQQNPHLETIELFVGITLTVIAILLLIISDKDTTTQLQGIFQDSDWVFENHQLIQRKRNKLEKAG